MDPNARKIILRYLKEIDRKNKIIKYIIETEISSESDGVSDFGDTSSESSESDFDTEILEPTPRNKIVITRKRR